MIKKAIKSIEEGIRKIEEMEEQKRKLTRHLNQVCADLETLCPFRVGDKVEVNDLAHTGKQMVVYRRDARKSISGWEWVLRGHIIKKDGTTGLNVGESRFPIEEGTMKRGVDEQQ